MKTFALTFHMPDEARVEVTAQERSADALLRKLTSSPWWVHHNPKTGETVALNLSGVRVHLTETN